MSINETVCTEWRCDDQNPCAQLRSPMDMTRQGWSVSLFQASQQWSTMAS
jgi:hypothetical protein